MLTGKRRNLRVGLAVFVVACTAIALVRSYGLREIHRADQSLNFALSDARPRADDWPWWRGADGRNVSVSERFPMNWPVSDSTGWRTAISGQGQSAPSIWGEFLFLVTADVNAQRVSLISLHRFTGKMFWQTELTQGGIPAGTEGTASTSANPACDGQHVYIVVPAHGELLVTAVDFKGRIAWQRAAGPYTSQRSYDSSPAIYKSLVIVALDEKNGGYLAALHRQTGDIIWRIRRPKGESSGSPIVATVAGSPQLILAGRGAITSYHPANGNELWTCRWSAEQVVNSVAFDAQHVFVTCRLPQPEILCIKADGQQDVTHSHLVWRRSNIACDRPSPVYHNGSLYVLADDGTLNCLETASGRVDWSKPLNGKFSASPVIAGNVLMCCNEAGMTNVIRLGNSRALVAENPLPDGIVASPIICGGAIFLRTQSGLQCISGSMPEPLVIRPELSRRQF